MMKIRRVFFILGALWLAACDLQPKIASIPDSIGEFISSRYPALLADPVKEPEIYNSAAGDYGVYASPELYGGDVGEYVNYAATDDYVFKDEYIYTPTETQEPEEKEPADTAEDTIIVPEPEAESESEPEPESEPQPEDIITVADYQTDELYVAPRAAAGTVVVRRGDTLYAIARAHNTSIANLAEINNLKSPYNLRIGQVLKLEKPAPKEIEKPKEVATKEVKPEKKPEPKATPKPEQKSEPKQARVTPKADVRVPVKTITVARGDTLYSLSRAYSVPVNDLAVMNNLSAPFALAVGQQLRVPDLPKAESPKKSVKQTEQPKKQENKNTENKKPESKPQQKKVKPEKVDSAAKVKTKAPDKNAPKKKEQVKTQKSAKAAPVQKKQPEPKTPKIAARSSSKFSWPVRGKILSYFGAKTGGLYNDGINISAAFDTPVRASENGVVAYAGNEVRGMGNLVIIQHEGGWMTVYAHMNSMVVRRGANVKVGQKIGTLGQTGKVNKPQLHFEIRKGTKAYNPADYLK